MDQVNQESESDTGKVIEEPVDDVIKHGPKS
ncbi:E domain-containing protein [Staphylococcus aureus]